MTKTKGEIISDANAENIKLDEQGRTADIQEQRFKQSAFPMIQGTSKHTSALKKKAKGMDGKACWKGYSLKGTKMKNGKRVDNCVKN
mgnify:FL=1|tara:strand:- start:65 stop:325 length:261 start_codon:yes stop_codon:yes gene_type:complete